MSITEKNEEDETDEHFYESLDRLLSSASCSCSNSSTNSNSEDENDDCFPTNASPFPKFPMGYDVWISEPSSVSERRNRLLHQMGLSGDASLSRVRTDTEMGRTEFGRSVSSDRCLTRGGSDSVPRSKSDGVAATSSTSTFIAAAAATSTSRNQCNSSSSSSDCYSILSIRSSVQKSGSFVSSHCNGVDLVKLLSDKNNGSFVSYSVVPNNLRSGDNFKSADEIRCDSTNLSIFRSANSVPNDESGSNGVSEEKVCTIKNLDNGKEFVVNEVREDGSWNKLKEVGTGKQLTMEEFEMSVGHSPIVQELMRRQNVENGSKDSNNLNEDGGGGGGQKVKKKGSWFKTIKSVASSVTGYKERRSTDERDTSSEKGGRRSSSATDEGQDVSFHLPERVRVRQYGKSCKELTALYKSQEIQAHSGSIWSIKFSLDGKYLASAGEDCVIHIWQVVESERKGDLLMEKQEESNFNLLFLASGSPEPTSLFPNLDIERKRRGRTSISRKSASLENIVVPGNVFGLSEKPICSFHGHLDDVLDLSWSKSQNLLSSSMDKTVRLWNLSSKTCLKVFSHSDYVTCIQFNPVDDRYFISGSLDAKVRIWSIPDRQVVDWNDVHEMVTAACYTPDGQGALVGSHRGSCRLYSTSENKLQQRSQINIQTKRKSHQKKITGFQFVPGSTSEVLITSADSRIRVIDGIDLVHKFKGFRNTNSQISASLTANGKYAVAASEDSYVYVWKKEFDSRPIRSKSVTVTYSYEYFYCQDVSVAIPWPGMSDTLGEEVNSGGQNGHDKNQDEVSAANHPPTPVEFSADDSSLSGSGCGYSPLHRTISSATNSYFFDRISATWPEEKLVLATRHQSPRVSMDFSNGVSESTSACGLVIVTAGLRGEIKTFQNFGFPTRI